MLFRSQTTSVLAIAIATEEAIVSLEKAEVATATEEAHPATGAIDHAAHDESEVAVATIATAQDPLLDGMTATETEDMSPVAEGGATGTSTETIATIDHGATLHEAHEVLHLLPVGLAALIFHHAAVLPPNILLRLAHLLTA